MNTLLILAIVMDVIGTIAGYGLIFLGFFSKDYYAISAGAVFVLASELSGISRKLDKE